MLVCKHTLIPCERDCGTRALCKREIEARVERERKPEHVFHVQPKAEPQLAEERDLKDWWC